MYFRKLNSVPSFSLLTFLPIRRCSQIQSGSIAPLCTSYLSLHTCHIYHPKNITAHKPKPIQCQTFIGSCATQYNAPIVAAAATVNLRRFFCFLLRFTFIAKWTKWTWWTWRRWRRAWRSWWVMWMMWSWTTHTTHVYTRFTFVNSHRRFQITIFHASVPIV